MKEIDKGGKGRWVGTPGAPSHAQLAVDLLEKMEMISDQFKTTAKGRNSTYLRCFFPFPAVPLVPLVPLTPSFTDSAAVSSSFLSFFSLAPAATDEVAHLHAVYVVDDDGHWWPLRVVEILDLVSGMVWWRCGRDEQGWNEWQCGVREWFVTCHSVILSIKWLKKHSLLPQYTLITEFCS